MIKASSFVRSVLILPQLWYTTNKQELGTVAKEAKAKITPHVGHNDHINNDHINKKQGNIPYTISGCANYRRISHTLWILTTR